MNRYEKTGDEVNVNYLMSFCGRTIFLVFLVILTPMITLADDEPFTSPANWGGTGLMEIPTARLMKEHSYRLGGGQVRPYRYYYGAISPLEGLEIDGRITQVVGVDTELGPAYGNYKDKSIDIKVRLLREGKYTPAFAIGIMDPHGTRIFASQYLVMSKQVYPFDFTLGFGNGRFGKRPVKLGDNSIKVEMFQDTKQWLKDSQFFWGVQFAPSDKYALMFEYSPIPFEKQKNDPAVRSGKYFQEPVPSKYNIGLRWMPVNWAELDLSYQRGNQIGMNFSMPFNIGKPLIPVYDHPYKESPEDSLLPMNARITEALFHSGFSNITLSLAGDELSVEAENERYFYCTRALGVMLKVVTDIVPEAVGRIRLIVLENGIPMVEATTSKEKATGMFSEKLPLLTFMNDVKVSTDLSSPIEGDNRHINRFTYRINPAFQTFLNDPSGFFKYRAGVSGSVSYHPWRGGSLVSGLEIYPVNNISSSNLPGKLPVRSDIALYRKSKLALGMLMFDQIYKTSNEYYGKLSAGLLEVEYAGLDAEIAKPLFDGRLLVGLSGSVVKKRDPDNPFKLKLNDIKDVYTTQFLNGRLNFPDKEIFVEVKAGKFLAGDKGARITVSKFINGVIVSVWYSITGTSMFKDPFNRGYHDKGIALSIPLRLFKGADSKSVFSYALSPWTRDVAQDISHFNNLFDFIGRNTKIFLDRDSKEWYK